MTKTALKGHSLKIAIKKISDEFYDAYNFDWRLADENTPRDRRDRFYYMFKKNDASIEPKVHILCPFDWFKTYCPNCDTQLFSAIVGSSSRYFKCPQCDYEHVHSEGW